MFIVRENWQLDWIYSHNLEECRMQCQLSELSFHLRNFIKSSQPMKMAPLLYFSLPDNIGVLSLWQNLVSYFYRKQNLASYDCGKI